MTADLIPSYEEALTALENGNDKTIKRAVLAFSIHDDEYLAEVSAAVKQLLQRPNLTEKQITSIKRALHGLSRMPLRTPGIDIQISLRIEGEGGAKSYDLIIDSTQFATESGGYVKFDSGSDSFSGPTFRVETDYREEGLVIGALSWPNSFSSLEGAELHIADLSDDMLLEWDNPDGSEFWEWIANHD
jgi:hypothetical protein